MLRRACLRGLAPDGVCRAARVTADAVGSYPAFSPLPTSHRDGWAAVFFSVALSSAFPPPGVTRHRALWSSDFPPAAPWRKAGDHPSGVDEEQSAPWTRSAQWVQTEKMRPPQPRVPLFALLGAVVPALCGCSSSLVALHAPNITPGSAREATTVEIEPLVLTAAGVVEGDIAPPGPAAVLTAAMKAELEGRALHGGERGGYRARCTLDRFAVRAKTSMIGQDEMLVLYADLSCEAKRVEDGAVVWRGEIRGRAAASAPNVLGSDASTTQRLADRATSDVAREMASDFALRALALVAEPSARVFADEGQMRAEAGLDDTPYGPAALQENPAAVEGAMRALNEHDATTRAGAWNVVAMAAGPGEPWPAPEKVSLDDDPLVRFVQYKALARAGSVGALEQLKGATPKEEEALLAEFLKDALASAGVGVIRLKRP